MTQPPASVPVSEGAESVSNVGLDPNEEFPNQPEGWLMLWCPICLYSVIWTEAEWITYGEVEWNELLREAVQHDH